MRPVVAVVHPSLRAAVKTGTLRAGDSRGESHRSGWTGKEPRMYRHILIPTDGSALAENAVTHGLALAKSVGAKVTAIVVETPFSVYDVPESRMTQMPEAFKQYAEQIKAHGAKVLNHVSGLANAAGVSCDTLQVEHYHPYEAIIAAAEDRACDLIVMASHGRSGISAILLGSVTAKVLTHTKIPVLVCH
jgi:nucleotide-binding universal stress UspA family protein